jgi:hypothetical protein
VILVADGQLLATLGTTGGQHTTAVGGSHSLTEAMLVVATAIVGLERSFHNLMFVSILYFAQFRRQRYDISARRREVGRIFFAKKCIF